MLKDLNELHEFILEKYPYMSFVDESCMYKAKFNKIVMVFDKFDGLLYIDNKTSFDKLRQTPIVLRFPLKEGRLLNAIEFAKTKKFIELSNDFIDTPEFNDQNKRRSDGYFGFQKRVKHIKKRIKKEFVRQK